ncbi:hypothetical protein VP01_2985g7 [Puccinia sorghi]|uniref:Uncharacterized protein n=1 Tax=Puccinia sorghi TaxID=27349 RepID=A0A0L6V0L5_9BASI|nr:hypothetical protein VP01_2985g7 [Puccinia sorghi]
MPLILNEPQTQHELFQKSEELTLPQKPFIKNQKKIISTDFIILPLTEKQAARKQPPSPNRHPSYLLKNFPHRPHYYPSHSVGAQEGYCLSPVPHCLRQFTSYSLSEQTPPPPQQQQRCPSRTRISQNTTDNHSRSLASSAALSSLPSLSTTVASLSSSSSSSSPPLSFTSLSKPSQSTSHLRINAHEKHSESRLLTTDNQSLASSQGPPRCVLPTKKVLPVPPSLSPRVRQIFMDKIGSQQAPSCAQLPRRRKKTPALEPVAPSL